MYKNLTKKIFEKRRIDLIKKSNQIKTKYKSIKIETKLK